MIILGDAMLEHDNSIRESCRSGDALYIKALEATRQCLKAKLRPEDKVKLDYALALLKEATEEQIERRDIYTFEAQRMAKVSANLASPNTKKISISDIAKAVCEHSDVTLGEIRSRSRVREIVRPRQEIMYLACKLCPHLSLPQIGLYLKRDHTTIMHGRNVHRKRIEEAT